MLISYSRPSPITWSLTGTGAAFLTSSARLDNGRPTSATRLQWLSGAQTTASVLSLRGDWGFDEQIIVGAAGLIGLTLPVGLRIVCSLKFAGFWIYRTTEGVVVERADGVRVAWFTFPVNVLSVPVQGVQFSIYNDVGGVVSPVAADSDFEIGEVWAGISSEWCIRTTYQSDRNDFSKQKTSINGQPFPTRRRASSISNLEFTPVIYGSAFGSVGTTSFKSIRAELLGYQPCVVVPMTAEPFTGASAIDSAYVNENAEFGYAKTLGPIVGEAPRFVFSATFEAPPVILP